MKLAIETDSLKSIYGAFQLSLHLFFRSHGLQKCCCCFNYCDHNRNPEHCPVLLNCYKIYFTNWENSGKFFSVCNYGKLHTMWAMQHLKAHATYCLLNYFPILTKWNQQPHNSYHDTCTSKKLSWTPLNHNVFFCFLFVCFFGGGCCFLKKADLLLYPMSLNVTLWNSDFIRWETDYFLFLDKTHLLQLCRSDFPSTYMCMCLCLCLCSFAIRFEVK